MLAERETECEGGVASEDGRRLELVDSSVSGSCDGVVGDQHEVGPESTPEPTARKVARRHIDSGKVTECKHCGKNHPLYATGTICFNAFFYIWERDLLYMAKKEEGWRKLANALGFRDEKIDAEWKHPDEGRLIPYQNIKTGEYLI